MSLSSRRRASLPRRSAPLAFALIGVALLSLGGCASLPSSGPEAHQVVDASRGPDPAFRIVDLTDASLSDLVVKAPPDLSAFAAVGKISTDAPADSIAVGDMVQVTVFEVGSALFGAPNTLQSAAAATLGAAPPPTASGSSLPPMPVGPDGSIVVPYVGPVQAAGRTPQAVASEIQAGLRGKSQSPQVVVSIREDLGNTVVMIGDIRSPGRKSLSYRREHLLDMIAMSGGATAPKQDVLVRLTRDGHTVETRLSSIESGTIGDVTLEPQDRIELINRPRTFTAFGATGRVSEIPFQNPRLTLAEALARIGGPLDNQADATGVFLFRPRQPHQVIPVVYRLNLKDPRSYIVAQNFQVEDGDLVLVANARSNAWYKFLSIVNTIVNPIVTAHYLAN